MMKTSEGCKATTDAAASAGLRLCQTIWPDWIMLDMQVFVMSG
jgi:hypothetical protein